MMISRWTAVNVGMLLSVCVRIAKLIEHAPPSSQITLAVFMHSHFNIQFKIPFFILWLFLKVFLKCEIIFRTQMDSLVKYMSRAINLPSQAKYPKVSGQLVRKLLVMYPVFLLAVAFFCL